MSTYLIEAAVGALLIQTDDNGAISNSFQIRLDYLSDS